MNLSRVAIFAACALSFGGTSNQPDPRAPSAQKHRFVVELDPKAEVKRGAIDGVRTVEELSAADKRYVVYEADSAEVLVKLLEGAGVSPKKVTEVKDINSPMRGGGNAAGEQP